jgi:hypothetical protein
MDLVGLESLGPNLSHIHRLSQPYEGSFVKLSRKEWLGARIFIRIAAAVQQPNGTIAPTHYLCVCSINSQASEGSGFGPTANCTYIKHVALYFVHVVLLEIKQGPLNTSMCVVKQIKIILFYSGQSSTF